MQRAPYSVAFRTPVQAAGGCGASIAAADRRRGIRNALECADFAVGADDAFQNTIRGALCHGA